MANKSHLKPKARKLYLEKGYTGKQIAEELHITEATASNWIKPWKAEKEARINGVAERAENIKKVISNLTEQQLEMANERRTAVIKGDKKAIALLDGYAVGLADQISKWSKALMLLEKDNRVTLAVYLEVMENIFKCLSAEDAALFRKTLDFQQSHVELMSIQLG